MKVSYQWLSEYVDLTDFSAADLAEKLTRSGIEVDVVESRNKGVEKVVAGYVQVKDKHPDADKLSVCTVDIGTDEKLQIVCGAGNIQAGQKVPVAVIGAVLPGDFKIKKAKLRGVESQGMICSAKELGLNDRLLPKEIQEGILVLPNDTLVGEDILSVLALKDEILELDLTPNRSDCLSMIGTAYEIGAIIGRDVKLPKLDPAKFLRNKDELGQADKISVKISAFEQCDHYAARYIEGIHIAPSPLWMQNRLMAAGIRPINNIVDVTNYVMLEYGQPLHAFDADSLEQGRIDVRLANPGETMVTLDDVERALEPQMLLITDGNKPVAIAGVMGSASSEVTSSTTRIVLESARFAGNSVRKTSRKLGLRSEASLRFEKEVDAQAVIPALNRAAALIAQYAGGHLTGEIVEDIIKTRVEISITLSLKKVNEYLGTNISIAELKSIYSRLNFICEEEADESLKIHVPSRRGDITRDVDLIEEAARLYGYDLIPTTLMQGVTTPGSLNKKQMIRRSIRRILTDSGLNEVINYSFTHMDKIRSFAGLFQDAKPIALSMPMSEDRSVLRTSLIPHMLDAAVYNRNRNNDNMAIFEIGSVFVTNEQQISELPEEKVMLSILLTGARDSAHWSAKSSTYDFYDLKGMAEKLFSYLGLEHISYASAEMEKLHPGRTASLILKSSDSNQEDILIGFMGQLHPTLQQELDLEDTYVLEMELSPVYEHASFDINYRALPRFPSIVRDMAIVVDHNVHAADIVNKAIETGGAFLESIQVFDLYEGERLGADKKSIALSLVYRHPDRTLTDEEVSSLHGKVVEELEITYGAELRK